MIASVLYIINEVELSIYRFLSSGAKKSKKTASTGQARGRQGRREPQSGREGYWKRESVFDTPRPDLDQSRTID